MSMMIHGSGQRVAKFVRRTNIAIARLIDLFLQRFTLTIVSFASLILTVSVAIYNRECLLVLLGLLFRMPTLIKNASRH